MGYIIATVALWIIFFLLVKPGDRRGYFPVITFSALIGIVSDLIGVVYRQWEYNGPVLGGLSLWSVLGIASAEAGIFIRLSEWKWPYLWKMGYLFAWSAANTIFELFFVSIGWIVYHRWNPIRAFLFYLCFFGLIWLQEFWYNGTNRLRKG